MTLQGTALVTGGCGFIGSKVSDHLVRHGVDLAIVDNLALGRPENLAPETRAAARLIVADICDRDHMTAVFVEIRPRFVYHLAAIHFIPACESDRPRAIHVNVEGTQAVFDAAAATPSVEAVTIASTAAVYAPSAAPHSESSAVGPLDTYGYTKLWAEQIAHQFHERTATGVGIARLWNAFGPGETNPHLIPEIIHQLSRGDELRLGNLVSKRDYVFVEDLAEGIAAMAPAAATRGELTANLGSESQYDGNRVVRELGGLMGRSPRIVVDPARLRPSDRPECVSDCSTAHEALDWKAGTDLRTGLERALERPLAAGVSL